MKDYFRRITVDKINTQIRTLQCLLNEFPLDERVEKIDQINAIMEGWR